MSKYLITIFIFLILGFLFWGFKTYQDFKDTSKRVNNLPKTTVVEKEEAIPAVSVAASGLEVPWALAFLPDNSLIITERGGLLKKLKDSNVTTIATLPVKQIGEGGLHGVIIHPDFLKNNLVYFYYTYGKSGNNTQNKVVRFKLENDKLAEEKIIVDKIPGAPNHDGGRLKFGSDGYLYITTGDAQNPSLSQDKNSLAGKILRVKDDKVEVYSYGHRNPQGIAWDNKGWLWEVEHGQSATDELNQIGQGKNYGWPEIRGNQTQNGMEAPVLHSGSDTWAPAGLAFHNGSLYFGGLRGQALFQYIIDTKELKTHFKGEFGRIREVVLGPDNMLYITTSNKDGRGSPQSDDDKILRINPEKLK